jgi:hypothetical protein
MTMALTKLAAGCSPLLTPHHFLSGDVNLSPLPQLCAASCILAVSCGALAAPVDSNSPCSGRGGRVGLWGVRVADADPLGCLPFLGGLWGVVWSRVLCSFLL